jgi:hypothetical protein
MAATDSITHQLATRLDLPPSCIEFCPSAPDYFVVGTYNLVRNAEQEESSGKPQSRNGSLVLYKLSQRQTEGCQNPPACNECVADGRICDENPSGCASCVEKDTSCLPGPVSHPDVEL